MEVLSTPRQLIKLRQKAWFGDKEYWISFPEKWIVTIQGDQKISHLTNHQIFSSIRNPIESNSLHALAMKSWHPLILIDDLSRPTPVGPILKYVTKELVSGGIPVENIRVLVATGTHAKITKEDLERKIGKDFPTEVKVLIHDCHHDCVLIGKTKAGTPVWMNKYLVESDLKIGIGGIYPHPIAGFSGGGKILALGATGYDTIRFLHDQKKGSTDRSGNIDHEFRKEINEICLMAGFDFSINVTINQHRQINKVFAGNPEITFHQAVNYAIENYSIPVERAADIVIVDTYPFDLDFQFAFDRCLWPFQSSSAQSVKIILTSSPKGVGSHELFPVTHQITTRLKRRIKYFKLADLLSIPKRIKVLNLISSRRKLPLCVVSENIYPQELIKIMPRGVVFKSWDTMVKNLEDRFGVDSELRVCIYRVAPLMLSKRK